MTFEYLSCYFPVLTTAFILKLLQLTSFRLMRLFPLKAWLSFDSFLLERTGVVVGRRGGCPLVTTATSVRLTWATSCARRFLSCPLSSMDPTTDVSYLELVSKIAFCPSPAGDRSSSQRFAVHCHYSYQLPASTAIAAAAVCTLYT